MQFSFSYSAFLFYGSIQSMIRYPAVQFMRRYVRVNLLLCLLVFACPSIGNAEGTIGRAEEVREILGQALEAATRIQNPFHRNSIIDDIAATYAVAGDPDRALELAERKDNEIRSYTLVTISRALFEQGQGRQAAKIISHITDDDGKAWTLGELGRYYIARGEQGEAKERLDQALKSAEGIVYGLRRTGIMLRIVDAQVSAEDRNNAEATLRRTLELALTTQDSFERDLEFILIMQMQAQLGDESAAWQTLEKIEDGFRREKGTRWAKTRTSSTGS